MVCPSSLFTAPREKQTFQHNLPQRTLNKKQLKWHFETLNLNMILTLDID